MVKPQFIDFEKRLPMRRKFEYGRLERGSQLRDESGRLFVIKEVFWITPDRPMISLVSR